MLNLWEKDRCEAYADTFDESHENLSCSLQLIDYSKGYLFSNIRSELRSIMIDAIEKTGTQIVYKEATYLYYLSKEDALKFTVE